MHSHLIDKQQQRCAHHSSENKPTNESRKERQKLTQFISARAWKCVCVFLSFTDFISVVSAIYH